MAFPQARPTLYKGTQMRSRTEARFAAHLDQCGFPWAYEPVCFADERGQYLPDFEVTMMAGWRLFIEVKGQRLDQGQYDDLLGKARIIFQSVPASIVAIAHPEGPNDWWLKVFGFGTTIDPHKAADLSRQVEELLV